VRLSVFGAACNHAYLEMKNDPGIVSPHPHKIEPQPQVYVVTENPDGSQHLMAVHKVSFRNGDLYIKAKEIE
jgi:hypothetical protein